MEWIAIAFLLTWNVFLTKRILQLRDAIKNINSR